MTYMCTETCSKLHNMMRGSKHDEAATICDKFVFNKVIEKYQKIFFCKLYFLNFD